MVDQTKSRILNAAGEVFAEKGFEQATIREICKRAEANVAAVNYHFRDKHSLYLEAVRQAFCEGEDAISWEVPEKTPPEQQLLVFIETMMQDMLNRESPTWYLELMMREMARPTDACEELVQDYIGPKFRLLLQILDQLIPEDVPLPKRHLLGFSVVGQCLLYRFHRPIGRLLIGDEEFESLFNVSYLSRHIWRFCLEDLAQAAADEGDPS